MSACQGEQIGVNFSSIARTVALFRRSYECAKKFDQNTLLQSMVFGQKSQISISEKKDVIRKGMSRGADWCKFQLRSTFQ